MNRIRLLAVFAGAVVVLSAQAPGTADRFEVASIKPANPSTLYASSGWQGAGWSATNFTVFMLIERAYPEYGDPRRIVGGPPWIHGDKFDVRAKAASVPTPAALNQMLRHLLAERFALRTHVEQRELDVYVARLSRTDGRIGPWLVPTAPECATARLERRPTPDGCDRLVRARASAGGGPALTLLALSMPSLFQVFRQVGGFEHPIVDRTGLVGLYDVSLQYQSADPLDVTAGGASLVVAAEDQLGLKFERGREQLEVLVIDSVQRPTSD